ncbi:hypothetical protein, partial [Micromonospora sp. WMMD736]|uniref:hypothetical protein n=1 Tax=Micromonospora sp. WMMD736 TaxID=3404112 RepID=UPI003B93324A
IANGGAATADEQTYHILSTQDLCNLVWPASQAQPNPERFGAICVRQGGVLLRLARAMPDVFTNTFDLDPGSAPELPITSVRINPDDPLSDWLIPDCYVPGRIDCRPR